MAAPLSYTDQLKQHRDTESDKGLHERMSERKALLRNINERRAREVELESRGIQNAGEGLRASEMFEQSFPKLAKDKDLFHIAVAMDAQQIAADDSRPTWNRYEDIGERLSQVAADPQVMFEIRSRDPQEVAALLLSAAPTSEAAAAGVVERMREARGIKGKN